MPLHLDEFQRPQFQAYIENVPPQREYKLARFMPRENTWDIDFAYQVIEGAYAQAASITGWNASAPLRDKKGISQAFGSVAKIQHGFRLDEKDLLAYNNPRADAERQQVVDRVYDQTDNLVVGVDDIEEYLRAQVIYTGVVKYDDPVNNIHLSIDFNRPEENHINVTTAWSDPASTPVTDLQAAVRQYRKMNMNQRPEVMHISPEVEAELLQNEQIRTQRFGTNSGGQLLTTADIQAVFTAMGIPNYEVNDDVVVIEDEEVTLLPTRTVALLGGQLGKTKVGPTVENNYQPGKFVQPIIETNPPAEIVIVGEAAFPSLERPKSVVTLGV